MVKCYSFLVSHKFKLLFGKGNMFNYKYIVLKRHIVEFKKDITRSYATNNNITLLSSNVLLLNGHQIPIDQFSWFEIGFCVPPGIAMCIYLCYRLTWLSYHACEFSIMKYIIDSGISTSLEEEQLSCFADNLFVIETQEGPKTPVMLSLMSGQ